MQACARGSYNMSIIILSVYNIQVSKDSMTGYTGEGKPPCIVMLLKAVSDKTTPPDLSLLVTLTGVREPNNRIVLERTAESNVISNYILDSHIKL